MPTAAATRKRKVGRPRLLDVPSMLTPREQILDAAAQLFADRAYAATSTREIADLVGIRQASLYYHFAGKEEIVAELLARTVRPTLDQIDRINVLATKSGPATALYALIMIDTKTLAEVPHNTGLLAGLPDVWTLEEVFAPYKASLNDLVDAYEQLCQEIAGLDLPRRMAMTLVEGVIRSRAEGETVDDNNRHAIAASVLRACGADQETITIAAAGSWAELVE